MKMVKSLLLGSAAGLVVVAGAQAADLPVKAAPVQYVKICNLYGAGFFYIPGTDMCLKMGGWVRTEIMGYYNGSTITSWTGDVNNNNTNNILWRARGYITADARNQTDYGTVRSYIAVGLSTTSIGLDGPANQFSANRAFIQLAGFTFGISQSFYDIYSQPAVGLTGAYPASDTGDPGWLVAGYTAQFGNGWSATLSAEMRRLSQVVNQNTNNAVTANPGGTIVGGAYGTPANFFAATGATAGAYGGNNVPDFVGNIRVDQAWGSAQVMGALHEINSNYYVTNTNPATPLTATAPGVGTQFTTIPLGLEASGRPSTAWGFAVGAGAKILTPFIWLSPYFGAGDYFQFQVNYTQGATRYADFSPNVNWYMQHGASAAYGVQSDAVYGGFVNPGGTVATTGPGVGIFAPFAGTATSLQLTTAWGVNAAYEHFWSKQWRTSLVGGYFAVNYNGTANAMLCAIEGQSGGVANSNFPVTTTAAAGATTANGVGNGAVAAAGCSNNWNAWWLGSRTQWNVTPDTYFALEAFYENMTSATTVNGIVPTGGATVNGIAPTGVIPATTQTNNLVSIGNQGNWMLRFRVHKDFYP